MRQVQTDLRKKNTGKVTLGKPSEQRKANLPGFTGNLPLPANNILNNVRLTAEEKEQLKSIGWTEGQPIPKNSAEIIDKAKKEFATIKETIVPTEDSHKFTPPKEVNIMDLSKDKQKEILESFKKAETQLAKPKLTRIPGAGPGINEALMLAAKEDDTVELLTSRKETEPENPELEKEEVLDAGAQPKLEYCPHCNWPLHLPDIEATQEDKFVFVQSILGGIRFTKDYELYDGQLILTFREPTSAESDLIQQQLQIDAFNEKLNTMSDYYQALMYYKLACCLARVTTTKNGPVNLPEISEYEIDIPEVPERKNELDKPKKADTVLPQIAKHVMEIALPTESVRRIAIVKLARFMRLREFIEARADDKGFCSATEEHV